MCWRGCCNGPFVLRYRESERKIKTQKNKTLGQNQIVNNKFSGNVVVCNIFFGFPVVSFDNFVHHITILLPKIFFFHKHRYYHHVFSVSGSIHFICHRQKRKRKSKVFSSVRNKSITNGIRKTSGKFRKKKKF